ncbi:hypothetical protein Psuf_050000 [Phytohabitans suffuscus]|uniref:MacB-like periplasmic core domain-containing protein n=1 Tax=Phytohabitans suffuscus TaxID=624315 RepID=A0A6F8YNI5_9ACTN|nr:hypothetical protein Psuf_050000 [Phytohabitans suffuscus]
MTSWLTALRIARREARRAKGRSALVVAMIALPVLALAFAAASYDMFRLRPAERADREMGAADARLLWEYDGRVTQDPRGNGWATEGPPAARPRTEAEVLAALPAGSRIIPTLEGYSDFRTASGIGTVGTRGLDVRDPLTAGLATLLDGRAPATSGEVAISPKAAERLGAGIGDTIRDPDRTRSWTVTGLVEFPDSLFETVVFLPGAMPTGPNTSDSQGWLWDAPAPVTWDQVKQLNQRGMVVFSRDVLLHPPPASQTPDMFRSSGWTPRRSASAAWSPASRSWRSCCWPARRSRWAPAAGGATSASSPPTGVPRHTCAASCSPTASCWARSARPPAW